MYKSPRHIFILLFVLVLGLSGYGQLRPILRPPGFRERVIRQQQAVQRVEVVKERYISRRLDLTQDESVKFWPVYRRYQADIAAIMVRKRINNSASQPDGAEQVRTELELEGDLVNVRKKYTDEFLRFLPPEKVSELFKAEKDFRDELIRQLRERTHPATTNPPN
ncbi:MAG: hypothetical protein JST19_21955 [Bacteroidetes bacterium]|nr:hypothetical protein [Bacteroidota bacterium]